MSKPNPKTVKDVLSHSFVKEYASYLRSTGKVRIRDQNAEPFFRTHGRGFLSGRCRRGLSGSVGGAVSTTVASR